MNMDALFEEVGKTIAVTGREAARKAKEVTENVQLKAQLATEKSHLKELYAALGKWYYEKSQGKAGRKRDSSGRRADSRYPVPACADCQNGREAGFCRGETALSGLRSKD